MHILRTLAVGLLLAADTVPALAADDILDAIDAGRKYMRAGSADLAGVS